MNHYERELREALSSPIAAGIFHFVPREDDVAARLEHAFPFADSKIDWANVRGHRTVEDAREFRRFFSARREELGGTEMAYYLNDNLTDHTIRGSLFAFERHLEAILSIPAHHYFVAQDFTWCMVHSMEGDVDFGWSASAS